MRPSFAKRLLKRWSRRLFAAGSRVCDAVDGRRTPGVRILTYHRIVDDPYDPFAVAPADFADQMDLLAKTGRVVSLQTALDSMKGGADPGPSIVLTFDDGTHDFASHAWPVLSRLRLPAAIYVNPSRIGSSGFLAWEDLLMVRRGGVEIGSHSLEHRSLGGLPINEVRRQVVESRRLLEDRLGCDVGSLAYPYGTVRDFNERIKNEVLRAGYRNACSSINGVNGRDCDRFALRRTKIEQGDRPIFPWILAGALDGWAFFDNHLSWIQNRYA